MTPPDNCKTGAPTAAPGSSPASAPSSPLPEGWHRSGFDEIANDAGYRIVKGQVNTFARSRAIYWAHTPAGGFLGTFPDPYLPDAIEACNAHAAHASHAART